MTHGFKIAGLALGLVVLGFGPAGAGGYKHSGTGSDIRSGTSTEGQDIAGPVSGAEPARASAAAP